MTGAFGAAAGVKALPIRRQCTAIAPFRGKRMVQLGIDEIGQAHRLGLFPYVPGLYPYVARAQGVFQLRQYAYFVETTIGSLFG